jgi:4-carboxymuconolactone decarboxylase
VSADGRPVADSSLDGRFPVLRPAELSEAQRDLYEAIVNSGRAREPRPFPIADEDGGLRGPFNSMLYVPALGHLLQEIGGFLRYQSSLTGRMREIAIIIVALHENSGYEWAVHTHQARLLGLTDNDLLILAQTEAGVLADPAEQSLADAVREILSTGAWSEATFLQIRGALGDPALFELAVLVSHYRLLALLLRLFGTNDTETIPLQRSSSDASHEPHMRA